MAHPLFAIQERLGGFKPMNGACDFAFRTYWITSPLTTTKTIFYLKASNFGAQQFNLSASYSSPPTSSYILSYVFFFWDCKVFSLPSLQS
jgi:hypothetical protein